MMIAALLALLAAEDVDTSNTATVPAENCNAGPDAEASLLEELAVEYSTVYDFADRPGGAQFGELLRLLLERRLLDPRWLMAASSDRKLRVMQAVRLLLRDTQFEGQFVSGGGVPVVASFFADCSLEHFSPSPPRFNAEMLTECASIIKKLVAKPANRTILLAGNVHVTLAYLLSTSDASLLPSLLLGLMGLTSGGEGAERVGSLEVGAQLLRMVYEYELPFSRMAAELLFRLARTETGRSTLLAADAVPRLLALFHVGLPPAVEDAVLRQFVLRTLCALLRESAGIQEARDAGAVAVLVALLRAERRRPLTVGSGTLCAACSAITRLAVDDKCASQLGQLNAVHVLGNILVDCWQAVAALHVSVGSPAGPIGGIPEASKAPLELCGSVFRALRYIFSFQQNRKAFKRLFPPDIFSLFIDVGHYAQGLNSYANLALAFMSLSATGIAQVEAALAEIDAAKEGLERRSVRGYALHELVGKGAFGSVFQARRERSTVQYAIKELPLDAVGLFGATSEEQTTSVVEVTSEVNILSSLVHPNIVRYYESFVENKNLYIVMELVDGVSLFDHITSTAEKGQRLPEQHIWQILVQVCLALSYIHTEKGIVHRDVTPSNILLDHGCRRAKLADFGLAKQKAVGGSIMRSAVGTITYCCPEIVQHSAYTDKADIWSLGCVLYSMIALRPPFDGSNPITVASKIVEGKYEPLNVRGYSERLVELVPWLLERDPERRPNVAALSARLAPRLMSELVNSSAAEDKLIHQLAFERERRSSDKELALRNQQALQRLLRATTTATHANGSISDRGGPTLNGQENSGVGSPGDGQDGGSPQSLTTARAGNAAAAASPKLTIKQNRLRQISDPLAEVLGLLQKLMFIQKLPPGFERDPRRRLVEQFLLNLFSPKHKPGAIKTELLQLLALAPEGIEGADGAMGLSYEELGQMVEEILTERAFYCKSSA